MRNYIWKFAKKNNEQKAVSMYDMTVNEIQIALNHCETICINKSRDTLGQEFILKEVDKQYETCITEQALRYLLSLKNKEDVRAFSRPDLILSISNAFHDGLEREEAKLPDLFKGLPVEFINVKLDNLLNACLDQLGIFNKKYIGKKFVQKLGIWLTHDEFKEIGRLKQTDIVKYIKEDLNLYNSKIVIKPTGLPYNEFKTLHNIGFKVKYSELSDTELKLLVNKVLPMLSDRIYMNIERWHVLRSELTEVLIEKTK